MQTPVIRSERFPCDIIPADRDAFFNAVRSVTIDEHKRYNIGTYKEKTLHIALKKYFEPCEDYHEVPVNGYIADIMRGNEIIEIETGGFSGLKPKLEKYLPDYKVTLVYPLPAVKYVSWIDGDTGDISKRSRSTRKTTAYDLLRQMVYILPFVKDDCLSAVSPLLEIDEYRNLDGWSRNRKRGSTRYDLAPTDIFGMIKLSDDEDYIRLVPDDLDEEFTAPEFAKEIKIGSYDAYAAVKVLEARGVIEKCGKKGRAAAYRRTFEK